MNENNAVFVAIDFTLGKEHIDRAIEADDMDNAREYGKKISKAQEEIKQNAKSVGGKLVFDGSISMVVYVPYDEQLIESFATAYERYMGQPANLGIGETLIEAHESLDAIDYKEEGNLVVSSNSIVENLMAIRRFYKQADRTIFDLKISKIIKSALLELKIITTEHKVYDIFLRLAKDNNLISIDDLQSFFFKPLEEMKNDIRTVYQGQKIAGIKFAVETQTYPGHSEINRDRHQKSPHKRFNWWSTEDYNEGKVDYEKTDKQYIPGNITNDSQEMSMGGEPGNAVYVP